MPGGVSDYTAERMLNKFLSAVTYTPAATHYFALFTTNPSAGGAGYVELTNTGYARISKTNNATTWPAWASAAKKNGVAIAWGAATEDWDEVVGVGVFDAAAAGNLLGWGVFVTARTVLDTETLTVPVDGGVITFLGEAAGVGGITDYSAGRLMDYEFSAAAYTPAATHYFGLMSTNPNPAGSGAVELSGGGYARISKTNNATTWPAWATLLKKNGVAIAWPAFTADMATIVGAGWWDAASAGNLLGWGKFTNTRTPLEDETFTLPANSGTFSAR